MDYVDKVMLLSGIRSLGFSIIWPYIGLILYRFNTPLWMIGIYYAAQAITGAAAQMVGGVLTDYLGRVRTMSIGIIGGVVTLAGAYLARDPILLMSLLLAQSIFSSMYAVASSTLVGDVRKGMENLVNAYSKVRVGANAGWALGPFIGGVAIQYIGYRSLFLLTATISFAALPLVSTIKDLKVRSRIKLTNISRDFSKFLVPSLFLFMVMGMMGFALAMYYNEVRGIPTSEVGMVFGLNGLLVVLLQERVGRFISKRNAIKWLTYGSIIYYASYSLVAFIGNFYLAMADVVAITMGEMIVSPLAQALAMNMAEADRRGQYMGLFNLATSIGRSAGSVLASETMQIYLYNPVILWQILSIPALLAAALYWAVLGSKSVELASPTA
ncbi:MFS transporter [Thermocladium modestius]|uniref:MFS transporter n=1 Tax=Thermocladium modestius TaxID=62609 RepID=A0A830GWL9_9CREN|nr:MFS transporter [Thermocladium modestius]GGP21890.1 MFS transporter [Thermocladium modestius]